MEPSYFSNTMQASGGERKRERECVIERKEERVCVYVCERERERKRARERERAQTPSSVIALRGK